MIALDQQQGKNTTLFCENQYKNNLWTNETDQLYYKQRMHNCYNHTGIEPGRSYCEDIFEFDPSWGKKQYWDCLFDKDLVVYPHEYCDSMFGEEPENDEIKAYIQGSSQRLTLEDAKKQILYENAVKISQCYSEYNIPKTEAICKVALAGDKLREERIKCYQEIQVYSKDYCETQYFSESHFANVLDYPTQEDRKRAFLDCLTSNGHELNQKFCDDDYKVRQQDEKYACYERIGLEIPKDRLYCEVKYERDFEEKYKCLD